MVVDQGLAHIVGRLIDGTYNSHTKEIGSMARILQDTLSFLDLCDILA